MKKIDNAIIEQAIVLRKQGLSYVEIGKQLKVTPDVLSKYVRKTAGIAKANFDKKIDEDKFDEL